MLSNIKNQFLLILLIIPFFSVAQKRKADKETKEWRYELEVEQQGTQGTYLIKVWSYSKKPETAIEQAKKNAVHGIIFRGFPERNRVPGQKALAQSPNLEQEHEKFFNDFFDDGGKYLKFVTLANNGAIGAGDRIKIGKEYKIGVVISVDVNSLRKDLEEAGIIKKLGGQF
jgi:hypothetical protein